jgi:hypothetical protein
VHTLDVNVSGDARSNLDSCPNRAPPCTLQCLQCLHDSTSKTVPDMPYPNFQVGRFMRAPQQARSRGVAEIAVQCFQAPRVHWENLEQISSRFRRRPARLAAAAPSAHQGGRIARAHSVTSTVCHAAVLHQAALGTTSAGRRWHSRAFKYSTTATFYVALCRLPFWTWLARHDGLHISRGCARARPPPIRKFACKCVRDVS